MKERAVSDELSSADAAATGTATPQRPTGKRSRRRALDTTADASEAAVTVVEDGEEAAPFKTKPPKKKKTDSGVSRNPITFVFNYLKQVIAELRKVIWPNRKQMVSYTSVVLVFLAFMVALIGVVDLGLGKLVLLVFG
jgi:preprotein translocase subunit SecE